MLRRRRHGHDRWADLIDGQSTASDDQLGRQLADLAEQIQAEAETLATVGTDAVLVLPSGVQVPAYLGHLDGDEW